MSKSESDLKTAFVKKLRERDWYARRFEDQYAVGVMDMLVCIPFGPTVAVEAKIIRGNVFGPTPRQFIELQRFSDRSTSNMYPTRRYSWMLGFHEGSMYLHQLADSVRVADCTKSLDGEHPVDFLTRFWTICQKTER